MHQKPILNLEHAGNTEIYNAGLILASFFTDRTIVAQLVSDDLCEEVETGILIRRVSYYS